jgi:cellulose synthase/poly-beta-1,6-N-acetylglucosamine synthase-like glycosyltransferase
MNKKSQSNQAINCSIGIMAYNEAANIGFLLESLIKQKLSSVIINKIVVVSSGSTDKTNEIVRQYCSKNRRIRLFIQEERKGKARAINDFLNLARDEIVIISSADILPEIDTIENLLTPFSDPNVGMTGVRPLPTNDPNKFIGFAVHLLWKLHHLISLETPKLGEMIAFRNIIDKIPGDSAVDEATIESIITRRGYKLKYVPEAIVRNKGPQNIKDFIVQRRRIFTGHLWLKRKTGYSVSTNEIFKILRLIPNAIEFKPKFILWTLGVIFLEFLARCLGSFDIYILNKNPFIWQPALTTKNL